MSGPISRRALLSTAASVGATALLPSLTSCTEGTPESRRLVLIYTPYGGGAEFWPSSGANTTDSAVLEPLGAHRDVITLVDGLDATSRRFAGSWMSAMTAFSGREPFGDGESFAPGHIDGPSLDTSLAETPGFSGRVLRFATGRMTTLRLHRVSFALDGRPYDVAQIAPHRTGLDEQQTGEAMDRIVAALSENEARVAVWRMATAADREVAGINVAGALASGDDFSAGLALARVRRFFAAQVNGLIDRLALASGGRRSLLDETLVAWTSGPCPRTPSAPVPFVIVGHGVPHGHLRVPPSSRDRYGDLLHSLGRAVVGPQLTTFGDPHFARGPLIEELV